MQKGNNCDTVQALEESNVSECGTKESVYSKNLELIFIAHGDDAAEAERATEELVVINSGLVRSIAIRFRDRGMELEDLIQIGTIGLVKAIRSFDLHFQAIIIPPTAVR